MTAIQTWGNGNLDANNLTAAAAQSLGGNQSGQVVKGSSIIATSESRTNTAYGTLTTPDQVSNVVLSSAGLLLVWYQATWQQSVASAASADIFIGSNQLVSYQNPVGGGPIANPGTIGSATNRASLLGTFYAGLNGSAGSSAYTGDATTGQIIGTNNDIYPGSPTIFANAGTYTVSVQFKSTSGSVTVSNRRLYVMALSFA